MGEFQSDTGMVITPTHQYELRAEYNNTTSSASDAMAILYLYLLEKDFHRPTSRNLQAGPVTPFEQLERFWRKTAAG